MNSLIMNSSGSDMNSFCNTVFVIVMQKKLLVVFVVDMTSDWTILILYIDAEYH